jgi:hypothetical protein
MPEVTIITDETRVVPGEVVDGRVLIDPLDLERAIGWSLRPEGLCQGTRCVPLLRPEELAVGDRVDVVGVADALARPHVVDEGGAIVAVALDPEARHRALQGREAPVFELPDLDGTLHASTEWRGKKKLLIAFSSW